MKREDRFGVVDIHRAVRLMAGVLEECVMTGYCVSTLLQLVFMIMFWIERGNVNVIECQDNESYKEMNAVFWNSVILFILNCLKGLSFCVYWNRTGGDRGLYQVNRVSVWP